MVDVLDWQWLLWLPSPSCKQKGLENWRTEDEHSRAGESPCSNTHRSCLGLVPSCLWRFLSTNCYRSGVRRVKLNSAKYVCIQSLASLPLTGCPCSVSLFYKMPTGLTTFNYQVPHTLAGDPHTQASKQPPVTNQIHFTPERDSQTNQIQGRRRGILG